MGKVIENTGTRISIESDNGAYRLTFSKRYEVGQTATGRERYNFIGWQVRAYKLRWMTWKVCDSSHIPQNYANKRTVLDFIATRPAFSMASRELKEAKRH